MTADPKTLAGWLPGHDARWVIATVLAVAGLLWVNLGNRIDDLRRDVTNQITELRLQMTELRTDLRRLDDRLRAVEVAVARSAESTPAQRSAPVPTPDESR